MTDERPSDELISIKGFDFILAVDNHPDIDDLVTFVVTATVLMPNGLANSEFASSFATIEQAERCFENHEKIAKKHKMVCVERIPIPEDCGKWSSLSKWRRRHIVCS